MSHQPMASDARPYFTREQYLDAERNQQWGERHEYEDGQIFPVARGSVNHSTINGNLFRQVANLIDAGGKPCRAFTQDLLVQCGPRIAYPDLVVVCGPVETVENKGEIVLNPLLVAEVLSPNTADFDRGSKFARYRSIPSLREYLIVAQSEILVEQWVGGGGKAWQLADESHDPFHTLTLASLPGIKILIEEIYQGVTWPQQT